MALYNWFTEGFDPTSVVTCITRSQLLQMVHEARPATGAFMGVLSDTAPDVVTYPDLAAAIWAETSGGNKTGNFFYYDGTTWQPWKLQDGTLTGDLFGDHTIDINKLELGLAGYVLGMNGAGTALLYDLAVSFIQDGQLNWIKLQNASGAGKFLLSGGGGVFAEQTFSTEVVALIQDTLLPATHVYDELGTAVLDQVLASLGPGLQSTWKYADQLLRNNTVPTNKLVYGAANAGKTLKVNADGTDVDYVSPNVGAVSVFTYGGAAGTAPQTIVSSGQQNINFNTTQANTPTLATLTANKFTFATTGRYLVRATVYITNLVLTTYGYVVWKNTTTGSEIEFEHFNSETTANYAWPCTVDLEAVFDVASITDTYELLLEWTGPGSGVQLDLGTHTPISLSGKPNRYQRISFTKLA